MKRVLIINLFLIIGILAFAETITVKEAEKVAKSHYFQSFNSVKNTKENSNTMQWENIKLSLQSSPEKNSEYNFYVFNVNDKEGFIVVSSESKIKPVLAYSFEGEFDYDNMAPAQKEWFKYYSDCIEYVATNDDINTTEDVAKEWRELFEFNPYTKSYSTKSTSPILLEGINWNQTWPYNSECPEDSRSSFNGRVPVGCVATSMCQIMKYYNWPPSGTGSKYHSSYNNGGYGNISINFGEQTYDWTAMPDVASKKENHELGKINYHAGVAVGMGWNYDGSGAYTDDVPEALEKYFKYSSSANMLSKRNFSDTEWKNKIKGEIDAKRPIIYAGRSTTVGHAWNCDGYQDDMFHMNWGWGGSGNCYCTLNNLISSGTPGGPEDNFNRDQRIIVNIIPEPNSYPEFCVGHKIITGNEGSFDDGSSIEKYIPNSSCIYTINPQCGSAISIEFTKFDLEPGANLYVYDGNENSNVLIETFNSNNEPYGMINAVNGALTIRFSTGDNKSTGEGWKLKYTTKTCVGNLREMKEQSGIIEDGSKDCEYSPASCSWRICPPGAEKITIYFDEFDLDNYDYVRIFNKNRGSNNLIHTFNKSNTPGGEYAMETDSIVIDFYATSITSGAKGWKLKYTTGTFGIENNELLSEIAIIPNPGNETSKLTINSPNDSDANIIVSNVLGKVISTKNIKLYSGCNELLINDLISNPVNGVYYVSVIVNSKIETIKFVVVD
jgi:hypothetical protein